MEYTIQKKHELSIQVTKKVAGGIVITTIRDIFENLKEGAYRMEIKAIRSIRTNQQNRYYWACLGMIAEESGYIIPELSNEEKKEIVDYLHEHFKSELLEKRVFRSVKDKRKRISIVGSTASLDTAEFSQYMNKILLKHPYLPTPEDKNLLEFIDRYYYR